MRRARREKTPARPSSFWPRSGYNDCACKGPLMLSNRRVSPQFARNLSRIVTAIFLCSALSSFCFAQDHHLSDGKRTLIEAAVSKFMASTHVPGVSVAVVENGEYEWAAGFGLADVENNAPASEHTLYRLGSISKPLTAVGALQLYQQGKLDLNAPVQKYCPVFPEKSKPI